MAIIKFIGDNRKLNKIERQHGTLVDVPGFVNQARTRYCFDTERDVMLKECLDCKGRFIVAHLDDNSEWVKHDDQMHAIKSGFRERCRDCLKKARNDEIEKGFVPSAKVMTKEISKSGTGGKKSLLIDESLHYRLRLRSAQMGKAIGVLVREFLEAGLKD